MLKPVSKFKLVWFVFRYFLIGKFHCDLPQSYKKFFKVGFYSLWFTITLSTSYSLHTFFEWLKGFFI